MKRSNLRFGLLVAVTLMSACKTNRVALRLAPLPIRPMPRILATGVPNALSKLTAIPVSNPFTEASNQKTGRTPDKLQVTGATPPVSFTTSIQVKGYLGAPAPGAPTGRISKAPKQTRPTTMSITYPSSGYANVSPIVVGSPKQETVKAQATSRYRPNFLVAQQWQHCLANQQRPNLTSLGQPLADSLQRKGLVSGRYRLLAAFMQPGETAPVTKNLPGTDTLVTRSTLRSTLIPAPMNKPQPPVSKPISPTRPVPGVITRNKSKYQRLAPADCIGTPVPAGGRQDQPVARSSAADQPVKTGVETAVRAVSCTDLLAQITLTGGCKSFSIGIAPTFEMTTWSCNASVGYLLLGAAKNQIFANGQGYFVIEVEPGALFKKEIGLEARGDTLWMCRSVLVGQTRQNVLTLFVREPLPPKDVARRRKFLFWSRS